MYQIKAEYELGIMHLCFYTDYNLEFLKTILKIDIDCMAQVQKKPPKVVLYFCVVI